MENDTPRRMPNVPPFVKFVCANVPMVFDDSLSYYEALCALWKYVQGMTDVINNNATLEEEFIEKFNVLSAKFDQLKLWVDTYFDNLDVQEEINNKLDEMVEDGTFSALIGEYIYGGFLNDNFYIYPIRKGRYLRKTAQNPEYDATVDFPIMQGGCYVGNNHFIQARLVNSTTNRTELQELNLETGEVIRTNILQLQHANSITYDPETNRLYVCSLILNNANTAYIYVLDYTSWNFIKTIDLTDQLELNEGTHSISYDVKTGKLILGVELKSYNSIRFFELDPESEELTPITLNDKYGLLTGRGANNDITVYDNRLYLLKHNPNCVSEWDLNTGNLVKVYNIPLITPEGWTQGECESITYSPEEKIFYLGAYNPDCNGGYVSLNSFYTFNMIQNQPLSKVYSSVGDIVKTVFVDIDSTEWNPKGTNASKFNTIGEAMQLLNLVENAGLNIILTNEKTYPYANIYSEKTVVITPADTAASPNTRVEGISIEDSNSIYITAIIINGTGSHDFDVRIRRSNVEMSSCRFENSHEAHIDMWHSSVRFFNIAAASGVTGAMFNSTAENALTCLDTTARYDVIGKMPTINKPVEIGYCGNLTTTLKDVTITNKNLLALSKNLWILCNGLYYYTDITIATQKTQNGNRNFTVILDNVMCKYQIVFDYDNSKIKCKLAKAYNLETGADVTASTTSTSLNVYVVE